jgi:serine/threonine-protein kinase HipA
MSRKKPTELRLLMNEATIGSVLRAGDKLSFRYADAYRQSLTATQLSLSMPLARAVHEDPIVSAFLWGLLPDNELTLEEWARREQVSPRSVFQLIGAVGEDLPGALQAGYPEAIANFAPRTRLKRISEQRLEEFVAQLMQSPGDTQITDEGGKFSLAGAQPKKAINWIDGVFYEPVGRTPSTHILKPPMPNLDGQIENEHFCLQLARAVGLRAASSRVLRLQRTAVILVERYDRLRLQGRRLLALTQPGGKVVRVHQEDLCQALGVHPSRKYQRDGGPSMAAIMKTLETSRTASSDRDLFMRACTLNFVIGGTDAHAKNYAVIHLEGGSFRLAPLYDVISVIPYEDRHRDRKLAMSVGGEYRYDRIAPRHWEREAETCGYDADAAVGHVRDLVARLPDAASDVLARCRADGLAVESLERLTALLAARCRALADRYGAEAVAACRVD